MASRRWIWEQYDHLVRRRYRAGAGGDAAVCGSRIIQEGAGHDHRLHAALLPCRSVEGGKQAVAETWRNITAVARFPWPSRQHEFRQPRAPDIMGQFVGAVEGIRAACLALDYPVVSGNVSLYNETNGKGILRPRRSAASAVLDDVERMATIAFKRAAAERSC